MAFADPLFLSLAPSLFSHFAAFQLEHKWSVPACLSTINDKKAEIHTLWYQKLRSVATLWSVCGLQSTGGIRVILKPQLCLYFLSYVQICFPSMRLNVGETDKISWQILPKIKALEVTFQSKEIIVSWKSSGANLHMHKDHQKTNSWSLFFGSFASFWPNLLCHWLRWESYRVAPVY